MPVVAVVNPKGGVGKTTLATNLAGYFASTGRRTMLGDFDRHFLRAAAGRHRVERDYRLVPASGLTAGVYLQGGTEHTHGLSSALLSNIAIRSGEIADSIVLRRTQRELGDTVGVARSAAWQRASSR